MINSEVKMNLLTKTLKNIKNVPSSNCENISSVILEQKKFGRLAQMARKYITIKGNKFCTTIKHCMVITSADHGVAKQGISAYPIETTMHMTANYLIAKGGSANALAALNGLAQFVAVAGVKLLRGRIKNIAHVRAVFVVAPPKQRGVFIQQHALDRAQVGGQTVHRLRNVIIFYVQHIASGKNLYLPRAV